MERKSTLLNNEIQHLGEMIQLVSYEMTILHDFMKEKFGNEMLIFSLVQCFQRKNNYDLQIFARLSYANN